MSVKEIMQELPKLTAEERSVISQRLRELAESDELVFLHEASDTMFQEMDKEEIKNARGKAG